MYDTYQQSLGMYYAVDQLSVSLRAAKSSELKKALREQKLERKALRNQRRADRRGQESYTTAV
ncbi:MAG TPA: hypothetical protein VIT65_18190 [Microlunatus sp.]